MNCLNGSDLHSNEYIIIVVVVVVVVAGVIIIDGQA